LIGGKDMFRFEKTLKGKPEDIEFYYVSLTVDDLSSIPSFNQEITSHETKEIKLEIKTKKFYFYIDFEI